ncbi:MAG: hypothetical protein M3Z00_05145 [Actinomycetota bacterium]|nr:hypothetical protein [Actinomycetota bacterium]
MVAAPLPRSRLGYGRRPPKKARALKLGPLLTGVIPPVPAHVDYGTDFTGWKMLGNDSAGDCVAVTWANQRALVTAALTGTARYPSQSEVWTFYQTQNPGFDPNGTTNGPGSSSTAVWRSRLPWNTWPASVAQMASKRSHLRRSTT